MGRARRFLEAYTARANWSVRPWCSWR